MDRKVFDGILENDHGKKNTVRNVSSIRSIRQRVYMISRDTFTSWAVTTKETKVRGSGHRGEFRIVRVYLQCTMGEVDLSATLLKELGVKGIYATKKSIGMASQ